jgi:hypothetical protein
MNSSSYGRPEVANYHSGPSYAIDFKRFQKFGGFERISPGSCMWRTGATSWLAPTPLPFVRNSQSWTERQTRRLPGGNTDTRGHTRELAHARRVLSQAQQMVSQVGRDCVLWIGAIHRGSSSNGTESSIEQKAKGGWACWL